MKPTILAIVALTVLAVAVPSELLAVSAIPVPITVTQPDGTKLRIRVTGDEWYSSTETEDGYAAVLDKDGWWVYADLDGTGRYIPTECRVNDRSSKAMALRDRVGRHLRESAAYVRARRSGPFNMPTTSILSRYPVAAKEAQIHINVPVLLIQYSNATATQTGDSFDRMMNTARYNNTGSFQDYFLEVSYDHLSVTAHVFPVWLTATNPRTDYGYHSGTDAYFHHATELVQEAVIKAENQFNPNWTDFDNDGNDSVDVVIVVHQGMGAESVAPPLRGELIWSHRSVLNWQGIWPDLSLVYDGVRIDDYTIQPELNGAGGHIEIGVFCHEFGHTLGLPDLYDIDPTNGKSTGIGNWGLMGSGSWGGDNVSPELPTHMCAWSKIEQEWIQPKVVIANTTGTQIKQVETEAEVYQLWIDAPSLKEYFLVENRQKTGFDYNLPIGGLAVWHIDRKQRRTDNRDNADENHKLVDIEEADGLMNMDDDAVLSRGDAGDLFPGSSGKTDFNDVTNPNSKDYTGAATQVCVENISASGPTMLADFCVPALGVPNLMIRDCREDVGNEPDVQCANNWFQSDDIWVDNNGDGTIDAPIKGKQNRLYVRVWNLGAASFDATVRCWYVNPSLGLNFPGTGTLIVNERTGLPSLTIPAPDHRAPLPLPANSGLGYRDYFLWTIPDPPPNIDHYCIGCVVENVADPQASDVPPDENNLGQINYWALALKSGTVPDKLAAVGSLATVFRERVRINNPFDAPSDFEVRVEGLLPGYDVTPGHVVPLLIEAHGDTTVTFDIIDESSAHKDSTPVAFRLYKMPEEILVGGLYHDCLIDNMPPESVSGFTVSLYEMLGDNFLPPFPKYELTWFGPTADTGGYEERVRYYEVHASPSRGALLDPGPETVVESTGDDWDPTRPGYQYYFFPPDDQNYYFTVVPVDLAENRGAAVPPQTAVEPPPLPSVKLDKTHYTHQGREESVSITIENSDLEMGGFDFLIAYDPTALSFMSAAPGQLLEDCGWEYFTYRHGVDGNCDEGCPSGLLRIIALADLNNGSAHPSCFGPPDTDPHELAVMKFYVTEDLTFEGQYIPITFYWADCGDNAVSSVDGNTTYLDQTIHNFAGTLLWDENDDSQFPEDARPAGTGAPDVCTEGGGPDKPAPIRFIDFWHGGIDIIPRDSLDVPGDINLNGIVNEVGDAVLLSNYFIYGNAVWDPLYAEGQIAATDVNMDGIVLTVADLVYLIRILTRDEMPFPKPASHELRASLEWRTENGELVVDWSSPVGAGAVLLVFDHRGAEFGEPIPGEGAAGMKVISHNNGAQLRVLVYGMERGAQTVAGGGTILRVPVITADPGAGLSEVEAVDYWGNPMTVTVAHSAYVPRTFVLYQNIPNPFNASTRIDFTLPEAGNVRLIVYDVLGRAVATLVDGHLEAGVHHIAWDARDGRGHEMASGVYFYRIVTATSQASRKMVLLK